MALGGLPEVALGGCSIHVLLVHGVSIGVRRLGVTFGPQRGGGARRTMSAWLVDFDADLVALVWSMGRCLVPAVLARGFFIPVAT